MLLLEWPGWDRRFAPVPPRPLQQKHVKTQPPANFFRIAGNILQKEDYYYKIREWVCRTSRNLTIYAAWQRKRQRQSMSASAILIHASSRRRRRIRIVPMKRATLA